MHRTVVLDVAGLSTDLLGPHTPCLSALAKEGGARPLRTVLPSVNCTVQSTFVTGTLPSRHGCVGSGWYFRDLAEIRLWRPSSHLVSGERIWDVARRHDAGFTCATIFWSHSLYSTADVAVTPRPIQRADGLELPDVHAQPTELHAELEAALGELPLFAFRGPRAGLRPLRWIADCARHVYDTRRPTLMLVHLPQLDDELQRLGPQHPDLGRPLRSVDAVAGELIAHVRKDGARVLVLSEHAVDEVAGPVHLNRALREAGLLRVRDERGREAIDPGACEAFAVADHQIAHVYVRRPERLDEVRRLVERLDGVDRVLDAAGKRAHGLDHPRAGELVALARPDRWFTYYFWLDDERAPDYARTVDAHHKPGYDPAELFVDPALPLPGAKVAFARLKKLLGFRSLLDVVPLDASLVKGSHGLACRGARGPLLLSSEPELLPDGAVDATQVKALVLDHLFGSFAVGAPYRDADARL